MPISFSINSSEDGKTLGEVLLKRGVSRRLVTRLKRIENGILCNGEKIRTIDLVKQGDKIILSEQDEKFLEPNISLNVPIVFEDEHLIVFNKPPFMPVHPSIKHQGDTLGNYFAAYCDGLTFRPVNRLDRDTSGCVVVAKNQYSALALQKTIDKVYFAVCHGHPEKTGCIDLPIARENESIIKRCVSSEGQSAVTNYEVIAQNEEYSLVKIILETGRTHQIRVHFSYIGHPLAGDDMYGGERTDFFERQALHCGEVSFTHPITNTLIGVKAEHEFDLDKLF